MTIAEIRQNIEKSLVDKIVESALIREKRMLISVKPGNLVEVARYLIFDLKCRFIIASALHTRLGFEIYYHFSFDANGLIINAHVILPEKKPRIESLANLFVAANWIEREMHELYGIDFLNHPKMEKLISDGNWEEGTYPYRNN